MFRGDNRNYSGFYRGGASCDSGVGVGVCGVSYCGCSRDGLVVVYLGSQYLAIVAILASGTETWVL